MTLVAADSQCPWQTPFKLAAQNTTIQVLGALSLLNKAKSAMFTFIGMQKVDKHPKSAQFNLNIVMDKNTSSNKTIS